MLVGLLAAGAAFAGFYSIGTARSRAMMRQPEPELAWLKNEFKLSDAEFARITRLHEAYLPECAQRCLRIAEQNRRLQQLLATNAAVTPEIRNLLAERAAMRADCEAEMLKHFLAVSRMMPPEQGRRYLEWVEQQTFLNGDAMEQRHHSGDAGPMADHHGM